MSALQSGPALSLDQARIRLEGALERLETAERQLRACDVQLSGRKWRTAVYGSPHALDALVRSAAALDADLERARRLHANEPCPELAALTDRVETAKAALASSARRRLPAQAEASLEALLHAVQQRAHAELPRPLEEGEHVVMSGGFTRDWWKASLAYTAGLGWLPVTAGWALQRFAGVGNMALPAMGAGIAAIIAAPLLFRGGSGRYVLTTRRLLYEAKKADPVDVTLSDIPPGTVRLSGALRTVELTSPRKLKLVGVHGAAQLAAQIDLERWLATKGAAPPEAPVRWRAHLMPHVVRSGRSTYVDAYLVLTPSGYAILPITSPDVRHGIAALTGASPRMSVSLEQLFAALGRLDPAQAEAAFEAVAHAIRGSISREKVVLRKRGFANVAGFAQGERTYWFEPMSYAEVSQFSSFISGWEQRELSDDDPRR